MKPSLTIARTIAECRAAVRARRSGEGTVGCVPTMGALHAGHRSLIQKARHECEVVTVTLFVNPIQFNDPADLLAYPRDEAADFRMLREDGADIVFAPAVEEIYPAGFETTIEPGGVARPLEGECRGPGHFRGVATVVTKLLEIVQPTVAYFGQKDAQQVAVIRQTVRDLALPVEIVALPTVREEDGLAMSSRNARLSGDARRRAPSLFAALQTILTAFGRGEDDAGVLRDLGMRTLDVDRIDYIEIVDPLTFTPLARARPGACVLVAAWIDGVRLIDNIVLDR